jgi:membrane-bound serine protease (ClpP class)
MFRAIRILLLIFLLVAVSAAIVEAQTGTPSVKVLTIKGAINPVIADFVKRGIEQAENERAIACIIQLDTPGGLDTAMRDIIQTMVSSIVPVVVYVSPSGARAASAGVFITMAAHVAAMAPNTAIGAASPVSIGAEGEQQMSDTMKEKVYNDAAAYIRSLAESHGRNMAWAERAVREAVSATEQEALALKVIDIVAPDLENLVSQINGRQVKMLGGYTVTINTSGANIDRIEMGWIADLLNTISEPNIAYLLLSVAMMGIMAEIFNPGLIFPGVVGGISLLLAFFALGMLPVNWAGILLIVLAFGLFIAEALTPGFGLLLGGGIVSLVIGSLILYKGDSAVFRVDPWLIALVTIMLAGFFGFILERVIRSNRRQAKTGREDLMGKTAMVRAALEPEGTVFFRGELWSARTDGEVVEPGEEVNIAGMDGLVLHVTRKKMKEENRK